MRMALLALLWGSSFLWIKIALNGGLAPLHITVIRCALGAAVLLALARSARQRLPRSRRTWAHLVVAAFFCNVLPFFLFGVGEQTVDSGVAGVLNATTPLWSMGIGLALGSERGRHPLRPDRSPPRLRRGAARLRPLAGERPDQLGRTAPPRRGRELRRRLRLHGPPSPRPGRRPARPVRIPAHRRDRPDHARPSRRPRRGGPTVGALLAVVALGIFGTGLTFHLNSRLIADEGPTAAATVGYLLPVVSVALGALVLGEQLNARVVTGMAVVLIGVGLTRTRRPGGPADGTTGARRRLGSTTG